MMFLSLLLVIITLSEGILSVDVKKLYHEKDLSEYCKRRVIPSIFLGRHVVDASAFILHFTRLNLPYSCYISIRAESGSNLIMALTMSNDVALHEYCSLNSPQLLVYEIGETFGGYWGMLPEVMVKHNPPQKPKYYTLKTTTTTTETTTEEYTETTTHKTTTAEVDDKESQEFIEVEVPLVEMSGHLEPGTEQLTSPFDVAAAFDYQYDVTPIPGVQYDTSILPLVQLSVRKQTDSGRRDDNQEPRYELDVIEQYTPDPRLTLLHFLPNNKHKVNENRLMSFGKKEVTKIKRRKQLRMTTAKTGRNINYVFPTTTMTNDKLTRNSWEIINKLMEKLKNSKDAENLKDSVDKQQLKDEAYNKSEIADNISNIKHNNSIYLQPSLSIFNNTKSETISPFKPKKEIPPLPIRSTSSPSKKLTLIHKDIQTMTADETLLQNIYPTSENIHSKNTMIKIAAPNQVTSQFTNYETSSIEGSSSSPKVEKSQTESSDQSRTIPPVSLLDHESWENILQVAPSMVVLLNQTVSYNVNSDPSSLNETHRKRLLKRKKRSIQAIAIENGRPHNITTRSQTSATTKRTFNVADIQEFARMVELKDDEVQGRVALRYLKQYVGPAIYNICGEPQLHNRHVHLFNSSRIVLSLQNFSLSSLSVVLTGARTLLSSEMRCSSTQLECQVSGARVCVDALAACDGVPNCGSYDIYDEDRLMCAVAVGLQRNVYLAAFTFLALLMTLCYAVHYWLRRCVPRVAEAFFVYKNGIENILYLDSIMRAPGDMGSDSRMFYRGSIFSSNNINTELIDEPEKTRSSRIYIQFFRKMFICFRKKEFKEELVEEHEMFSLGNKKTFSFTQLELTNTCISKALGPTVDTSVQTGESLEMAIFEKQREFKITKNMENPDYEVNDQRNNSIDPPIMINDSLITLDEPLPEDELSLMKFFRDSRSDSDDSVKRRGKEAAKMDFSTGAASSGEKELSSIVYDGLLTRPGPSGVKVKPKVQAKIGQSSKRLRFDETTTTIPTPILFEDEGDEEITSHGKQAAGSTSQNRSWRAQHLSPIREDDESAGKHRHFWDSKGKKSKKSNVSLR